MTRLPVPGQDDGIWGDILNEFLLVEHNADGTQKTLDITKGGTGATTASAARTSLGITSSNIPFTPTGTIAATDVQAAIAEVAAEAASAGNYFTQGGNAFGVDAVLGTTDTQPLIFTVANAEKARIDTNGNLGIGVSIPAQKLDVNGSINIVNNGEIQNGGRSWIQQGTSGTTRIYADSTGDTQFYFGGTRRIWFNTSGNVGLGATPTVDLEIARAVDGKSQIKLNNTSNTASAYSELLAQSGAVATYIGSTAPAYSGFGGNRGYVLQNGGAGLDVAASAVSGDLRLYTGGYAANKERLRIDSTGNVGIGTTSPVVTLDVVGASQINNSGSAINTAYSGNPLIALSSVQTAARFLRSSGQPNIFIGTNSSTPNQSSFLMGIRTGAYYNTTTPTYSGDFGVWSVSRFNDWAAQTTAAPLRMQHIWTTDGTSGRTDMQLLPFATESTGKLAYLYSQNLTLAASPTEPTAQLQLNISTAATIGQIIRAATSQSANLQEWQNSAGTVLSRVTAAGDINTGAVLIEQASPNITGSSNLNLIGNGGGRVRIWSTTTETARFDEAGNFNVGSPSSAPVARLAIMGSNAATPVSIFKAAASQSASLAEWWNSSNTVLASIASTGKFRSDVTGLGISVGGSTNVQFDYAGFGPAFSWDAANGRLNLIAGGSGVLPFVVKAATSQNADLTRWTDSSNTTLAKVDSSGGLYGLTMQDAAAAGPWLTFNSSTILAKPVTASQIPITIKGAASQSANLTEWQNSSGTVLASINSAGTATFNNLNMAQTTITASSDPALFVSQTNASNRAVVVRGAASQTGDLQQWQDSSGNSLAVVGSDGTMSIGGIADVARYFYLKRNNAIVGGMGSSNAQMTIFAGTSAVDTHLSIDSSGKVGLGIAAPTSKLDVNNPSALSSSAVARVKGSPTAAATITNKALTSNVATLTTSSSHGFTAGKRVTVAGVDATFNGTYTIASTPSSTTFTYAKTAGDVASTSASGTATSSAQSGNLQEWQDGTGTIYGSIDASGGFGVGSAGNGIATAPGLTIYSGYATGEANAANLRPLRWTTPSFVDAIEFLPVQAYNGGAHLRIQTKRNTGGTAPRYSYFFQGDDQDNSYPTVFSGMAINSTSAADATTGVGGVFSVFSTKIQNDGTTAVTAPGPTIWSDGTIKVTLAKPANSALILKAAASQSANLTEWQNSSGTVLTAINSSGNILFGSSADAGIARVTANEVRITPGWLYSPTGIYGGSGANGSSAKNALWASSASDVALQVRGATSQAANLQEWQNSSSALLARIASDGTIGGNSLEHIAGGGSYIQLSSSAGMTVTNRTASHIPLSVKGAASQSGNLQEWQISTGASRSFIDAQGALKVKSFSYVSGTNDPVNGEMLIGVDGSNQGIIKVGSTNNLSIISGGGDVLFSGGTRLIGNGGDITISANNNTTQSIYLTNHAPAGAVTVKVKASGAQSTTDLMQWTDNSNVALASVSSTGKLKLTPSSDTITNFQIIRFATGNNDFSVGNQQINLGNAKTLISWATAAALAIQPSASIAVGTIVAAHPTDQADVTKTIFRVTDNSYNTPWLNVIGGGSIGIGTADQFGSGVGVVGLKDAGTIPSTNPTGGGVLYSEGGVLKWRRTDGTIDIVGATTAADSDQIQLAHQVFS